MSEEQNEPAFSRVNFKTGLTEYVTNSVDLTACAKDRIEISFELLSAVAKTMAHIAVHDCDIELKNDDEFEHILTTVTKPANYVKQNVREYIDQYKEKNADVIKKSKQLYELHETLKLAKSLNIPERLARGETLTASERELHEQVEKSVLTLMAHDISTVLDDHDGPAKVEVELHDGGVISVRKVEG